MSSDAKSSELAELVNRLMALASEGVKDSAVGATAGSSPASQRLEDIKARLQIELGDELNLAREADDGEIEPSEVERELIRKALIGLKAQQIKKIAGDLHVFDDGRKEDIINRLVYESHVDPKELARLIIKHERDRETRGLNSYVFGFEDRPSDVRLLRKLLRGYEHRYIKAGVARWFMFDDVSVTDDGLLVTGTVRSYSVDPQHEADDYYLHATPSKARTKLLVAPESRFVTVQTGTYTNAQTAVRAFSLATGQKLARIALPAATAESLMVLDPKSLLALDMLHNRLNTGGFQIVDLNEVQFESPPTDRSKDETVPSIKSMTLSGRHLLSSRSACRLILEGRGLMSVSGQVSWKTWGDGENAFPFKLSLHSGYVNLFTGYGRNDPDVAARFHTGVQRVLLESSAMAHVDEESLEPLIAAMTERAATDQPVGRADILAPTLD